MAIASGLVGSWLVQGLGLGPVAPFDAAIVVMLAGGAVVAGTWEENRGANGGEGLLRQFAAAGATIARGERGARVGCVFAGCMASGHGGQTPPPARHRPCPPRHTRARVRAPQTSVLRCWA